MDQLPRIADVSRDRDERRDRAVAGAERRSGEDVIRERTHDVFPRFPRLRLPRIAFVFSDLVVPYF